MERKIQKNRTPISTTITAKLLPEDEAIIRAMVDRTRRQTGENLTTTKIVKDALKAYARENEVPDEEIKEWAGKIYKAKNITR